MAEIAAEPRHPCGATGTSDSRHLAFLISPETNDKPNWASGLMLACCASSPPHLKPSDTSRLQCSPTAVLHGPSQPSRISSSSSFGSEEQRAVERPCCSPSPSLELASSAPKLSVQPRPRALQFRPSTLRQAGLVALDYLPSCGCLFDGSPPPPPLAGRRTPPPLLQLPLLPARYASAPISGESMPVAALPPAVQAEPTATAAAPGRPVAAAAQAPTCSSRAAGCATQQPCHRQHPYPSVQSAVVDRWGSSFRFLLLRMRCLSGQQRFLVRGRNSATEAALLREASAELRAAKSANPKAPAAALEAVATGCMSWTNSDLTHLHITVQPAGAAELSGLTAALVRSALPSDIKVTTGASVSPVRNRSPEHPRHPSLPSVL